MPEFEPEDKTKVSCEGGMKTDILKKYRSVKTKKSPKALFINYVLEQT